VLVLTAINYLTICIFGTDSNSNFHSGITSVRSTIIFDLPCMHYRLTHKELQRFFILLSHCEAESLDLSVPVTVMGSLSPCNCYGFSFVTETNNINVPRKKNTAFCGCSVPSLSEMPSSSRRPQNME